MENNDVNDGSAWEFCRFTAEDNPHGMLEESSFSILFPKYRENVFQEIWPYLIKKFSEYSLKADLDIVKGEVTVYNTKKTWDPYIIIKARDMLKLIARSVPYNQAVKILEDNTFSEVITIKKMASNTERMLKRRARLIGKNGKTLQALELLTQSYIKVHGSTVTVIGPYQGIKAARKVIEDTFYNVHPIYNIKALMIKEQLSKDEKLSTKDWTKFIPTYKGQKPKQQAKKVKKKTKEYTPFPPPPVESKIDAQIASGEYFMSEKEKKMVRKNENTDKQTQKLEEKKREKAKKFKAPKSREEALKF